MFEYLEKSHLLLSIVSLDCTSQTNETGNSHMNWEENLKLIAELKERKLVTDKTIYVANHFLTMAACLMRRWRLYHKSMKSLRVMMV